MGRASTQAGRVVVLRRAGSEIRRDGAGRAKTPEVAAMALPVSRVAVGGAHGVPGVGW